MSAASRIRCQPEPEALKELRADFKDLSKGLPVRCIGMSVEKDQKEYQGKLIDLQKKMFDNPDISSMETNRPVTNLFEGCKTSLYISSGITFCFRPGLLNSTAIFPKNVFTNDFIGKPEHVVEKMADDESQRGCRRFASVYALGRAMKGREGFYGSLDKTLRHPPHFSLDAHKDSWTASVKSWIPMASPHNPGWSEGDKVSEVTDEALVKGYIKSHNEHLVSDLIPHAIYGCVHYLAPDSFSEGRSVYWNLGARIEAIQTIKHRIEAMTQAPVLMVVYSPMRGRIQEAGELSDMIPDGLEDWKIDDALRALTQQWIGDCTNQNINRLSIEILMARAPLKQQLLFMLQYSGLATGGLNSIIKPLYESVFEPIRPIRSPEDPSLTCQDLLDQYYYCPQSIEELRHCIDKKINPEDTRRPRTAEDAMRMVVSCECYCQLLESSCNIQFSEQENLLLMYASLLLNSTHPPEKAAEHFRNSFSKIFPGPATEKIAAAIELLNKPLAKEDNRLWLYQHVLQSAFRLPAFSRGQYPKTPGAQRPFITDVHFKSPEHLQHLKIPDDLMDNQKYRDGLEELLHGMCDLNEVTGAGALDDFRTREHFTTRHKTLPMTDKLNGLRATKFRTPANLWTAMHDQIKENAKREVCLAANARIDHTHQLDEFDMPDDFNTYDLLTASSDTTQKALHPLNVHVNFRGLAKPTHSLSHKDAKEIEHTPALKQMILDEDYKRPSQELLNEIRSPSKRH